MSIHLIACEVRTELDARRKDSLRVAVAGQAGAGRTSLVNGLAQPAPDGLAQPLRTWEAFTLLDMPAHAPADEGDGPGQHRTAVNPTLGPTLSPAFEKELRVADIGLLVIRQPLSRADMGVLREFQRRQIPWLIVANRHDLLGQPGMSRVDLERQLHATLTDQLDGAVPLLFTSCQLGTGLNLLRAWLRRNDGAARRLRWRRQADGAMRVLLARFRDRAQSRLLVTSLTQGLPSPEAGAAGPDDAADPEALRAMFNHLRSVYGLYPRDVERLKQHASPRVASLARQVAGYGTSRGVRQALKRHADSEARRGFALAHGLGRECLRYCHDLAHEALQLRLAP